MPASNRIPSIPSSHCLIQRVPSLLDISFIKVLLGKLASKCGCVEGTQYKNKGKALTKGGGFDVS